MYKKFIKCVVNMHKRMYSIMHTCSDCSCIKNIKT